MNEWYRVHRVVPGPRFVILNRLNGSKVSEHHTKTPFYPGRWT